MMHADHPRRPLAAALLLLTAAAAPAALAAPAEAPVVLAQGQPGAPGGQASAAAEQLIGQLRQAVRPTPAQMPQFEAVAQVLRANAQAEAGIQPPNPQGHAPDELGASIQLGQQELAGMQRLLQPLQALYASLSEPQKRAADNVFRRAQQASPPR